MKKIIGKGIAEELFGGQFELIEEGFFSGKYNMEFDLERATGLSRNEALPMFRFYGWKPWAVSLGFNQKESDINSDKCKEHGIDIVRRPTGGRAVLHADELTYSVVMKLQKNMTVHDAYRMIHIILLEGFKKLECKRDIAKVIGFEKSMPDFRSLYRESGMSVSCFASSARYEIEYKGRKIVGSAQRLFGDTLLQHGSILLGPGHTLLAELTNVSDRKKINSLKKYIQDHSATITEACGREVLYDECAGAVIKALEE